MYARVRSQGCAFRPRGGSVPLVIPFHSGLDSEEALKRAVLHRKNALFYRTLNGAQVRDLLMSLIHTGQLCEANSFHYLTELQRHPGELAACPSDWMPWNYRETLSRP